MAHMRRRRTYNKRYNIGRLMLRQLLLCALILLVIIAAKKTDATIIGNTYQAVKTQFTKDFSMTGITDTGKTVLSKFKEGTTAAVASLVNGNKRLDFSAPSDIPGSLNVSASSASAGKTVEFQSEKEIQVYASAGGTVSEIGDDAEGNKYIRIYHGNKLTSLYGGCTSTYVTALEKVKKGQMIGSVAAGEGHKLSFEIWDDAKLLDPSEYIAF